MNIEEAQNELMRIIHEEGGRHVGNAIDLLYRNGLEVVKTETKKDERSKFMEEWRKIWREYVGYGTSPDVFLEKLAELIDKHKADKDG